jgi:hypothetical protein
MIELVVGVCKNSSGLVSDTFFALSEHALFQNAEWFVVESNSEDDTHLELQELAAKCSQFNFQLLSRDDEASTRIERITRARNAYVSEIRRRQPAHVAVIDFDARLLGKFSFPSSLNVRQTKHIVTARQSWCYYDIFAFEQLELKESAEFRADNISFIARLWNWIFKVIPRQIFLTWKSRKVLQVRSAFGGFAVYPGEVFNSADYSAKPHANGACEHTVFHAKAREEGYQIFIDPTFVYGRSNEHCFASFFLLTLSKFFRIGHS